MPCCLRIWIRPSRWSATMPARLWTASSPFDASQFEIDELLMRATLVVDVMFRQEGMTVGFSKPDVHLAEALVRGAWSAYTLFSAAEFLRSRRYYGVIIAVHVVLEARKHGLRASGRCSLCLSGSVQVRVISA